MPLVFALAHAIFSNPQVALFGAFGSFALLLLVEFTGRPHVRLASYGGLFVVGAGFTVLGTVVSTQQGGGRRHHGGRRLRRALRRDRRATGGDGDDGCTLTFVLPVAVAQPASAIGPRLWAGRSPASSASPACMFVWPPPWHDNLRRRLSAAISAVARLADARGPRRGQTTRRTTTCRQNWQRLREQFSGTPYPPTGAAAGAVALSKLVGRVEWVAGNSVDDPGRTLGEPAAAGPGGHGQVAETLHQAAALICDGEGHPVQDQAHITALQQSTRRLEQLIDAALEDDVSSLTAAEAAPAPRRTVDLADHVNIAGTLDPGFHARALGIATEMVADAALEAAGAEPWSAAASAWRTSSTPHVFAHRLLSHLSFRSVWFRNALRGAVGLALAVGVIEVTNVSHGFWVVLGTMSVLRSNALGTGATALRAVGGTALGFVVGSLIMIGVADHLVLLWVLLPLAVLRLGNRTRHDLLLPPGQAAFTLLVIILFNIIQPIGWKVGLTRIEDVAIGCGVSIIVGFLFWPRGATAALGRALSTAFATSSGYLADAVERLTMPRRHVDTDASQLPSHRAYLLLDDAFRQFFTERGAKVVSVETISRLFTGSNRLRLAAYTLGTLPVRPPAAGQSELESVAVAQAILRDSYATSHRWYEDFAELLADRRAALDEPPPHGEVLHEVLRKAFEDVREQRRAPIGSR